LLNGRQDLGPAVWRAHAFDGSTTADSGLRGAPPREVLLRLEEIKAGTIKGRPDIGFRLADADDLIRTCVIEALLAAVVVTVSAARRRHRRMPRAAARV
jgi:hypothetical protein